MRILLLAFLSIFLLSSSVQEEERIAWSEGYRLSWADFKGEPKMGNVYVASTNSGMSLRNSLGEKSLGENSSVMASGGFGLTAAGVASSFRSDS